MLAIFATCLVHAAEERIIRSYSSNGLYTLWGRVTEIPKDQRTRANQYCAVYFETWVRAANDAQREVDAGIYHFDLCTSAAAYDWDDFLDDLEHKRLPNSLKIKAAHELGGLPKKPDLDKNLIQRFLQMIPGKVIFKESNDAEIARFLSAWEE